MLIKRLSDALFKKYSEGGKRSVFVVNNTPLVNQQANVFRLNTGLEVGEYVGDKFDAWNAQMWKEELDRVQVLVMTAQILNEALAHGFIGLINYFLSHKCFEREIYHINFFSHFRSEKAKFGNIR